MRWRLAAAVAVLAAAGAVALALHSRGGDSPAVSASVPALAPRGANLWVDENGGRCARAAQPGDYADDTACASLDEAFAAAQPGDTIFVKGGVYPAQTVKDAPAHTGEAATTQIESAPGEDVQLADLVNDGADNVRYKDFHFPLRRGGVACPCGPSARAGKHVTFEDMRAAALYIGGVGGPDRPSHITFKGGVYGGKQNVCPGGGLSIMPLAGDIADTSQMPHDIVLDGVTIKDMTVTADCPADQNHMDCLHVWPVDGFTLRNSVISNCENYGVLIESNQSAAPDRILIENNFFGPVRTNCGFALRGSAAERFDGSVVIRNNTADTCLTPQTTNTLAPGAVVFSGNVTRDLTECRDGVRYDHNVVLQGGVTCSPTDRSVPSLGLTGPLGTYDRLHPTQTPDLHLTADSPAIDAAGDGPCGSGSGPPCTDIDGQRRPRGRAFDAGADER